MKMVMKWVGVVYIVMELFKHHVAVDVVQLRYEAS